MSESTTTSEDNHSSEFDQVMSKVNVELDKLSEKQKNTLHGHQEEQVGQDRNSTLETKINDRLQIQTPSIDDEIVIKFETYGTESNWTLVAKDDLNSETDLIPDWKLGKNVECRVKLVRMRNSPAAMRFQSHVSWPHVQSSVSESKVSKDIPIFEFDNVGSKIKVELDVSGEEHGSTLHGHQNEQNQQDPNSVGGQEISGDPLQIEPPFIDEEIDIKYEEQNWALNRGNDLDLDLDDEFLKMNPTPGQPVPNQDSEQIDLNRLHLDLLQCELDCGTCQKYIRKLMEHIRCAHSIAQPTCDPLHIDPQEMGRSSFIEVKCVEDKVIEKMDCSVETESDPDFVGEYGSDSDSDPDDSASTHLTRNPTRRSVVKGKSGLETHMICHTGVKPFKCEQCAKNFTTRNHLTLHLKTHTGEKAFKCDECKESFSLKSNLQRHRIRHTGMKPFNCTVCGNCYSQKSHLEAHMICHTGVKPFKCEKCAKDFTRKDKLNEHLKTHTGEKPFKCEECEESFSQKSHLERHRIRHSGKKPFNCRECGKCFSQKNGLEAHMSCHTGVKLFKCEQCVKSFARKDHLSSHLRTHTGEMPFKCDECEESFKWKNNLSRHMRSHTGEQTFNCETCGKNFRRKSELTDHMRSHTGEELFKSVECEVDFTKSSDLSPHKKNVHKHVYQIQD